MAEKCQKLPKDYNKIFRLQNVSVSKNKLKFSKTIHYTAKGFSTQNLIISALLFPSHQDGILILKRHLINGKGNRNGNA